MIRKERDESSPHYSAAHRPGAPGAIEVRFNEIFCICMIKGRLDRGCGIVLLTAPAQADEILQAASA